MQRSLKLTSLELLSPEDMAIRLGAIVAIGIIAQWLAWRLKLPSILVLLISGVVFGPVLGFLEVDKLFGPALVPIVSLAVAVILFEGGLSLDMAELKKIGVVVRSMLSVGVIITWVLTAFAAYYILEINFSISILIGSILVVTGPTVIGPLLRQIRPVGSVGSILKWEGIIIDPVGVLLAVLVFEVIILEEKTHAPLMAAITILSTVGIGIGVGYVLGWVFKELLKRRLCPDYLENAVALMMVVGGFSLSNYLQHESGLVTVTVMGVVLASQKQVSMDNIMEFKENLQVLLISFLFVVLASRLKIDDLEKFVNWKMALFLGIMVLIVRPASVFLSTIKSDLSFKEKIFLSWMAPRGIVAAAMSSVFALELVKFRKPGTEFLVPVVFMVIIVSVGVYGLTAGPLAYWLKLAFPNPQGILIVGGHYWARELARILLDNGIQVLVVDTNGRHIEMCEAIDVPAVQANILAENIFEELNLQGIGSLVGLTPNEEVNSMAALRFSTYFGKNRVYQLSNQEKAAVSKKALASELKGRILFSDGMTYQFISDQIASSASIESQCIISSDDLILKKPSLQIPMFIISEGNLLKIYAADNAFTPKEGDTLIYLNVEQPNL